MPLPRYLLLIICCFTLCAAFSSCRSVESDGLYVIPLTDTVSLAGSSPYDRSFGVADTAAWEAVVAAADTIVNFPDNRFKMRSNRIWYQGKFVDGKLIANEQYPGWKKVDAPRAPARELVHLPSGQRVRASLRSAQAILDGEAITIGLLHVEGPQYENDPPPVGQPDWLILLPAETENVKLNLQHGSSNVGPISNQTAFRVGRHVYALTNVSDDYRSLTVERLADARDLPLTAELQTQYRQVPVLDKDRVPTTLRRTPGRELMLYFFLQIDLLADNVIQLDSAYHQLPPQAQDQLDIALINRWDDLDMPVDFAALYNLKLPIYHEDYNTCDGLICSSIYPAVIHVDAKGRIVTYQGGQTYLMNYLEELATGEGKSSK